MRLFKRHDSTAGTELTCVHGVLIPHWDRPEDMGNDLLASHFTCQACDTVLTPGEAREITGRAAFLFARTG